MPLSAPLLVPTAHAERPLTRAERRQPPVLPLPGSFDLALTVAADPAALAALRHVIGGIATALGLDVAGASDVRLALTEVCTAIVRSADADDVLDVEAALQDGAMRLVVRGKGLLVPGSPDGFPLPLVAALTKTLELRRVPRGGTEVVMTFPLVHHP